jgi:hypothetical protein
MKGLRKGHSETSKPEPGGHCDESLSEPRIRVRDRFLISLLVCGPMLRATVRTLPQPAHNNLTNRS